MVEKTEAEKAQEVFERRFAEQRSQHDHQFQVAMKIHEVRCAELREGFEDRKKELLAQNDGLLGAVGRLHAENEAFRKQVPELETRLERFEHEMVSLQGRMKAQCEQVRADAKKDIEEAKAEAKTQVARLTAMLDKARTRKPKKK